MVTNLYVLPLQLVLAQMKFLEMLKIVMHAKTVKMDKFLMGIKAHALLNKMNKLTQPIIKLMQTQMIKKGMMEVFKVIAAQ